MTTCVTPKQSHMTLKDKIFNILAGYGLMVVWVVIVVGIFKGLYNANISTLSDLFQSQFSPFSQPSIWFMIFMSCVWAPIWEEAVFRYAPLQLIRSSQVDSLSVVLLSSALFGWLHGGAGNVMIQGVYGLIFSWVYIKNDYSIVSSMFLHSLWNASVMLFNHFN